MAASKKPKPKKVSKKSEQISSNKKKSGTKVSNLPNKKEATQNVLKRIPINTEIRPITYAEYMSDTFSAKYKSYASLNINDLNNTLDPLYLESSTFDHRLKLDDEITQLKRQLKKSADELKDTKADREQKVEAFEKLRSELTAKEKINHILTRISEDGRKKLLASEEFQDLFKNSKKCDTVVVSIDIRRSTELMLKARTPELFSKFITELSLKLSQIIISNFGIFDKFTGDGILAFFPKFYSGDEAVIRAIRAANQCHIAFTEHYNTSKQCFNVFVKDVGLGIGIDYGKVTLVNTQSELTVVGIPVVYACRFSGVSAGKTLLNHPALEEIIRLCPTMVSFEESEILIKNEGNVLGYHVSLNEAAYKVDNPNWEELIKKYK